MTKRMLALLLALGLLGGCSPAAAQPDAVQPQYEQVTLCLPDSAGDGLVEKAVQVERTEDMADELVQALVGEGVLPADTEVNQWKSDGATPPAISVDLNAAFAEGLLNQGTTGETGMLAALVNTLWAYYAPAELTLTADGKAIEIGHNRYDAPFTGPMTLDGWA